MDTVQIQAISCALMCFAAGVATGDRHNVWSATMKVAFALTAIGFVVNFVSKLGE